MSKTNYSVARVKTRTRASVGKFERHIERKNEHYENMNVDLSRTPMNVAYKSCGGLTYNEYLDKLVAEKTVSFRGLKADAKVFDEMILDVNSDYFERHGGYEYAKRFYEEAFHFAEKVYGSEHIISAVLHADEQNTALSEKYGRPIYHYHMHIIALPVVDKEVLWTKRCKDKALVGTVKEVIHQISHSKKWKSEQAKDEQGESMVNEKGKPILLPSYSILQDRFFEHMQEAGFTDFERGEKGSTAENLSSTAFKVQEETKRLAHIEQQIQEKTVRLGDAEKSFMTFAEIDSSGKKGLTGKYSVSSADYKKLTDLAKRSYAAESDVEKIKREYHSLYQENFRLQQRVNYLERALSELEEKCRPYLEALKAAPQKVKEFIDNILETVRLKKKPEKDIFYEPIKNPKRKEENVR